MSGWFGGKDSSSSSSGGGGGGRPNRGRSTEEILQEEMQKLQVLEGIKNLNSITERCFEVCVNNFRTRKLESSEESCFKKCFEKHIKISLRMQKTFQESQLIQQQQLQEKENKDFSL
eukprot:TRINITY_DN2297_c0_g1_i2.p1 TRINITY_DN2297_c0_g1~~TRINITY_DN2297_c0_g1_i2.p1  ORF type:complete len:117 (-),score=25.76 TRINITY_DN2297_c0_g1_i2:288-638(-)